MKVLGNVIWFCFLGGFFSWLLWLIACLLAYISIVGIPWGRACWNISEMAAWPFGKEAINRRELTDRRDFGTGIFGSVGNVLWLLLVGVWLALAHTISGLALCITIIGIPFGLQHFKLAGLALWPIGKAIVAKELAEEARKTNAKSNLEKVRSGTPVVAIKDYEL